MGEVKKLISTSTETSPVLVELLRILTLTIDKCIFAIDITEHIIGIVYALFGSM